MHLEEIRLEEQIDFLLGVLATRTDAIRFTELLRRPWWRLEWIVTFLAILELIRLGKIIRSAGRGVRGDLHPGPGSGDDSGGTNPAADVSIDPISPAATREGVSS